MGPGRRTVARRGLDSEIFDKGKACQKAALGIKTRRRRAGRRTQMRNGKMCGKAAARVMWMNTEGSDASGKNG